MHKDNCPIDYVQVGLDTAKYYKKEEIKHPRDSIPFYIKFFDTILGILLVIVMLIALAIIGIYQIVSYPILTIKKLFTKRCKSNNNT